MKLIPQNPPRAFKAGRHQIQILDCGKIELAADEQLTFVTASGTEYDIARKSWGYYATPSLNARLPEHRLRALLACNDQSRYFVLLVEKGHEPAMQAYLTSESLSIVAWLDSTETLRAIGGTAKTCALCGSTGFDVAFHYDAPPEGEVRFSTREGAAYNRDILKCRTCSHYYSVHEMDLSALYEGDYVSATYKDAAGIARTFNKIISLDPSRSDNAGRVRRLKEFAAGHFGDRLKSAPSILDVGSGLGVFPYAIQKEGWSCTALDPDARAAEHLRTTVGVKAVCDDFLRSQTLGRFDVVSFNKVLEHVQDPVAMLAKARDNLDPGGFIYVELPDGEMASSEGKGREEFFIDHWHVFSFVSLGLLAQKAGFAPLLIERLREPSTKFTLRAFLTLAS